MATSDLFPLVHRIDSNGIALNVLELAPENKATATLVMHHGLRDSAYALLPIASVLSEHFHVLLPELRGHGQSDTSDAYGVFDFVLDVHEVISTLAGDRLALLGHSLGGHIVSKYAAIFPERVEAVAVIEGLGPPHRAHETNEAAEMQVLQFMILNRLRQQPRRSRPIRNEADALERLLRKNPRLERNQAADLVPHLLRPIAGGFEWAFDSRASSVFVGASRKKTTPNSGAALRRRALSSAAHCPSNTGGLRWATRYSTVISLKTKCSSELTCLMTVSTTGLSIQAIWFTTTNPAAWPMSV